MKNVLFASALIVGLAGAVSANAGHGHHHGHQMPKHGSYQVTDPCCNTDCHNMQGDPRAMAPGSNFHGADAGMVYTHEGPAMVHKGHSMAENPESMPKGTHKHAMAHHAHKDMHKGAMKN